LSEFLTHLNTIESSIQFTTEHGKRCLPFLDLLIERSPGGHLRSAAYCKPTHSDIYLDFRSEHPVQHKQSVINTLFKRSEKLSSTAQTLNSEMKYVKRTLLLNGYPKWMNQNKRRNNTTDLSLDLKSFYLKQPTWERFSNEFWRDIVYGLLSNL